MKYLKKQLIFFLLLFANLLVNAQVGINTPTPSPLSEIDIQNKDHSQPKGILIPRLNTSQRNAIDLSQDTVNLGEGLFIYNVDEGCFNYYDIISMRWQSLCGGATRALGSVQCSDIRVNGVYYVGVTLDVNNYIEAKVTVNSPGSYTFVATPQVSNGYYFATTGQVLSTGTYTIKIPAFGTPNVSGIDVVNIRMNGQPINSLCPSKNISIREQIVLYNLDCNSSKVNGSYTQDSELDGTNTILMNLTNISATSVGSAYDVQASVENDIGFSFRGQGVIANAGTQQVVLYGRGTPTITQSRAGLTITCNSTLTPGGDTCTSDSIDVLDPPGYTLDCSSISSNTLYQAGLPINTLNLVVNVPAANNGETYLIETNEVNGISYSGLGTLITGSHTVSLQAKGSPTALGPVSFNISCNSVAASNTTCTADVTIVNKALKVMSFGIDARYTVSASNVNGISAFLNSSDHFGVSDPGVNPQFYYQNGWNIIPESATGNALETSIQSNKPDIIVVAWGWSPDQATGTAIRNYLLRGGIVLCCLETNSQSFLRGVFALSNINVSNSNGRNNEVYQFLPSGLNEDVIINGPYGNLEGTYWGDEGGPTQIVNSLPSNTVMYSNGVDVSHNNGNSARASAFRMTDLDFVYFGEGGFTGSDGDANGGYMFGNYSGQNNSIMPAWFDTNAYPVIKNTYGGGARQFPVNNSMFFANFMVWAADRVREKGFPVSSN